MILPKLQGLGQGPQATTGGRQGWQTGTLWYMLAQQRAKAEGGSVTITPKGDVVITSGDQAKAVAQARADADLQNYASAAQSEASLAKSLLQAMVAGHMEAWRMTELEQRVQAACDYATRAKDAYNKVLSFKLPHANQGEWARWYDDADAACKAAKDALAKAKAIPKMEDQTPPPLMTTGPGISGGELLLLAGAGAAAFFLLRR